MRFAWPSALLVTIVVAGCQSHNTGPSETENPTRPLPASPETRKMVIYALKRDKSPVDLDAKGWVLGADLEVPVDRPLLWTGVAGIRFPVWSAPEQAGTQFHAADFTDANDGSGSRMKFGGETDWAGKKTNFYALDMRTGTLLGVDDSSVTEYRFDPNSDARMVGVTHRFKPEPAKPFEAEIIPGPKAGTPSDWPEFKAHSNPNVKRQNAVDWSTDIEIDGPEDDQLAIRSFLYYLRSAIPHDPPYQMSPMGKGSTIYQGHVFWDADIWLIPALAFIDPQPLLNGFAEYRSLRLQPSGPPYSWESAVSGKELAPSSMQREIHISGDVLWNLNFMAALGAKVPDLPRITQTIAKFYDSQLTPRPGSPGFYDLKNVVSPDENHTGNNDLYTNLLAQFSLQKAGISKKLYLPKDSQTFLTYENDPIKSYKQATAVLSIYPLQYPEAEKEAKAMLERFQDKVTKNGPAMTESIHALIWARLGETEKAYDYWQNSWKPYVKGPLMLFSEKRNSLRTYFITGAAGSLQTVIYGFLGFRVDDSPQKSASWTKKLLNGKWLSITPHLPSAWRAATFKNFAVLGKRYTLTVTRENGAQRVSVKPSAK